MPSELKFNVYWPSHLTLKSWLFWNWKRHIHWLNNWCYFFILPWLASSSCTDKSAGNDEITQWVDHVYDWAGRRWLSLHAVLLNFASKLTNCLGCCSCSSKKKIIMSAAQFARSLIERRVMPTITGHFKTAVAGL